MDPLDGGASRGAPSGARAASAELAAALLSRARHNADNLARTAFYLAYWREHPEVMWALLAHLVSRNAGYQMSDLRRHVERCRRGKLWLGSIPGHLPAVSAVERAFGEILRFLEAGNYLIFHDAYAQLTAYAAVKRVFLATRDEGAADVLGELPELGVDPTIVAVWRVFFEEARSSGFWAEVPMVERASLRPVARMALASVVNEQAYLEDKLVSPVGRASRFVDPRAPFSLWFDVAAVLGLTRLVFPVAEASEPGRAARLCIHTFGGEDLRAGHGGGAARGADGGPWWAVHPALGGARTPSFASLRARIDTGRALYFGLFMADSARAAGVVRWAVHGPAHTGERSVYDPVGFAPTSRGPGLSSRRLPEGPMSRWPGPEGVTPGFWSERFSCDPSDVEPLRTDPFQGVFGHEAEVVTGRPLAEVIDPARLWPG